MASNYVRIGGRAYGDGELLVVPSTEPLYRTSSGLLTNPEALFLVYYDEMHDAMALAPLAWEVAARLFKDELQARLDQVRPRSF